MLPGDAGLMVTAGHQQVLARHSIRADSCATARQSRSTLLLYCFHVLATRAIKDVNLRHSLKIKMADEMHGAMTIGAR